MVATPLQRAAALGSIEEAEKLILTGAKPDVQTRRGRSALHYASENGHEKILTLLITSGAQVDLPNKWGRTALHYAASKHRVNCLKILIKNGADPNKQDVDHQTALYHAVAASTRPQQEDKALDTVAVLISGGASSNIPDKSGITPLHVAAELGNTQICVHLMEDGRAQVNAIDQHGATPLHYAVHQSRWHVAEVLLTFGACSNVQDNAGLSADSRIETRGYIVAVDLKTLPSGGRQGHADSGFKEEHSRELRCYLRDEFGRPIPFDEEFGERRKFGAGEALPTERNKVSLLTGDLMMVVDVNSCLIRLNETEGLGLVKRTSEVERIERDISSYIKAALESMILEQPRFQCNLLQAGSTAENTKVGKPDEIDFMCILTELSKASYPYESPSDPPGYLRIRMHSQEMERWKDFLDSDGFLLAEKLHLQFHSLFDLHSENADLTAMSTCLHKVRDYSHQAKGGVTVDMSQTKPGSRLFFLWRGCQFKRVVVTVDLIPAIEIAGWPNSAMRPPDTGSEQYHVIPKVSPSIQNSPNAGLYWRISTSMAEERIFCAMDSSPRSCYTICKSLIQCPDPHLLFPENVCAANKELRLLMFTVHRLRLYDDFINSYLIKMIFCRERMDQKEKSNWCWSAVGNRVSEILNKLMKELKQGYVPSHFIRDYNVLTISR